MKPCKWCLHTENIPPFVQPWSVPSAEDEDGLSWRLGTAMNLWQGLGALLLPGCGTRWHIHCPGHCPVPALGNTKGTAAFAVRGSPLSPSQSEARTPGNLLPTWKGCGCTANPGHSVLPEKQETCTGCCHATCREKVQQNSQFREANTKSSGKS